ncbi:hypothetical protein [Paenibacillus pseudetheri]|uniref:Uncharacterized protein n=1 Tax=Paenibacillus pseudetheri TaxID=2897682 RepID=A0ABN8F9Y3_9BACL|nr:hypothetical protein [Paenibacillus pseudetheri]CAH1053997.1 hypothetical protein PAECIP111894_00142 [Paenibacillus pseudetheri]
MRLPRDRVSISEVLATDSAILDKLFEFYDYSAGEYFFIKDQPDKEWIIEAEDREGDNFNAIYDGGKVIDYYKNCLPLISTAAIIDMITYYGSLELRAWGEGWLLIHEGLIESAEGDDLVGFLWKTLVHMVAK